MGLKLLELGLFGPWGPLLCIGPSLVRPITGRVKSAFILEGLDLGFRPTVMVYNLFVIRVICLCSLWDLPVR